MSKINQELSWRTNDNASIICILLSFVIVPIVYLTFNTKYSFYSCLDQVDGNKIVCAQLKLEQMEKEYKK